jgi:hypothetical protein
MAAVRPVVAGADPLRLRNEIIDVRIHGAVILRPQMRLPKRAKVVDVTDELQKLAEGAPLL